MDSTLSAQRPDRTKRPAMLQHTTDTHLGGNTSVQYFQPFIIYRTCVQSRMFAADGRRRKIFDNRGNRNQDWEPPQPRYYGAPRVPQPDYVALTLGNIRM